MHKYQNMQNSYFEKYFKILSLKHRPDYFSNVLSEEQQKRDRFEFKIKIYIKVLSHVTFL